MRRWPLGYVGRSRAWPKAFVLFTLYLRTRLLAISALVFVGSAAAPSLAQTITDGDTLKMGGATFRLWGIDAPEAKQECPDGWPAGRMATTRFCL